MGFFGGSGEAESDDGDHGLCAIYYAIVTQNDDTEGSVRIKVRYPWMAGGDVDESFWAPLCVPMCGDEFGTYTVPEVNDTVLVMFVAGDIRHPVVVGSAYSETDPPPEVNDDGKNDFRLIKSRSGHRFILDDSDSAKVLLTDREDKRVFSVGNHAKGGASEQNAYGVSAPPDLSGDAGKGVSVAALTGTMNFICPSGEFKVTAKNCDINATGDIDIKSGGMMKVAGSRSGNLTSSSDGKYEGSTVVVN